MIFNGDNPGHMEDVLLFMKAGVPIENHILTIEAPGVETQGWVLCRHDLPTSAWIKSLSKNPGCYNGLVFRLA